MSGGQFNVPLVIRMTTGAGRQVAAQHSHSLEGWYAHIPGHSDRRARDAGGCARHAVDGAGGSRPGADLRARRALQHEGRAGRRRRRRWTSTTPRVRRAGTDVTLITYGGTLWKTLEAAEELATERIEAEVIDLRTLRPLDDETILASVARTHRAVIVDEGWRSGSISAEISARITRRRFYDSTRRWSGSAAPRCPCPMPSIWRRPRLPQVRDDRRGGSRGWWAERMAEFRMPVLGADMDEGTLVEWLVKPGDQVNRGDIIAVVGTEKSDIEVEVYEDGVVDQLLAKAGETLPVGAVIAVIKEEGEAAAEPVREAEQPMLRLRPSLFLQQLVYGSRRWPVALLRSSASTSVACRALGRRLRSAKDDVERAAAALKKAPTEKPTAPDFRAGMRRAIAAAMARSNREIPHYYLETRIDLQRALRFLEAENQKRSVKDRLLSVILLIKAVALALHDVPELNAYWIDDQLQLKEAVHIGFAISLRQGGLVVPAILDADRKSLDELMQAMRDLITRARSGRLRSSEITDATMTITNLGDLGVETVHGVIYPPQVALVGFGRIIESPWAENGMLGIRPVVSATLAGDHRATDGHRGAQFLTALNQHLQEPEKL